MMISMKFRVFYSDGVVNDITVASTSYDDARCHAIRRATKFKPDATVYRISQYTETFGWIPVYRHVFEGEAA